MRNIHDGVMYACMHRSSFVHELEILHFKAQDSTVCFCLYGAF